MTVPASSRQTQIFTDRAEALGHFFHRAGEAPRLLAFDEELGCPLAHALAALEWTVGVGVLSEDDLVHAARLGADTAAAVVERRRGARRMYVYLGPRMDAPPAEPHEGSLLYDEPGVRAYEFPERAHALAHFLRVTHGAGGVWSTRAKRAPELRHIKRWMAALFRAPTQGAQQLVAGWFATGGAGFLFLPAVAGDPHVYEEVGLDG